MREGELLDGRFELGPRAGEGAMGVVHRARDRASGSFVAVKLLHEGSSLSLERFAQEARALARIEHPGVVRYVAHGADEAAPYLAMEWLEGETLEARLRRGPLAPTDAVMLADSLAEALAALHAESVVHRDLKPGNLWLVGGELGRVKILDLGIAHLADATRAMTRTGEVLGTPSYMSPEQVRGLSSLDARADVHAFGAVLFECLTGRPPFRGSDLLAIALKVLLEVPARLADLVTGVPEPLDRLVAASLRKAPAERPRDGAELVRRLRAPLGSDTEGGPRGAALTSSEQRLFTIVLAEPPSGKDEGPHASTIKIADLDDTTTALRDIAREYSAGVEALSGRAHAIVLSGFASARDQAAQAASCALRVLSRLPSKAAVAVATGRGEVSLGAMTGVAIDRAVSLLRELERAPPGSPRHVRLDDVTAGLLDERFELGGDEQCLSLLGAREASSTSRSVVGRATPFVGRDREVMTLEALVAESIAESVARVALVTAPPGTGKSRLRREALARLACRDEPARVLEAQAGPLGAGSSFALLADIVRREVHLGHGELPALQRKKLGARVARHLDAEEGARVADYLAEMMGLGDPVTARTELRAAQQDPKVLGERIQRAFVAWLEADLAHEPLLIVLEDLHWGDRASVAAIDLALRKLGETRLSVLAFARPEVHAIFPDLFRDRGVLSIELGGLSKRAATRLVKELLGDRLDERAIDELVVRADGNAFFLEELVRAAGAGAAGAPETVLAMIGARLASLDDDSRRVLRAASVFGRVFPRGGAAELVGDPAIVQLRLEELEKREVVVRQPEARFAADEGWAFVHELARDAAYAMLTTKDRALGHRLAGAWLEAAGEKDPLVLAQHFELGGDRERAAAAFARASFLAFEANDYAAVLDRAKRAQSSGLAGVDLSRVRRLETQVYAMQGKTADALRCAEAALALAPVKSIPWFGAATELVSVFLTASLFERARELATIVASFDLDEAPAEQVVATLRTARTLFYANMYDEAAGLVARAAARAESAFATEPLVLGELAYERANVAYFDGRLDEAIAQFRGAADCYSRAGDERRSWQTRGAAGYLLQLAGCYEESAAVFRAGLASGAYVMTIDRSNLGVALARTGHAAEARRFAEEGLEATRHIPRHHAFALGYASVVHLALGEPERAQSSVDEARRLAPPEDLEAEIALSGIHAIVRLELGDPDGALEAAERGLAALAKMPRVPVGELRLRWARAAALAQKGDARAADAVILARRRLDELASKIASPELRRRFLEAVPEHAAIAKLATA